MKILGIIPARGGSKGIPKKNIKLINGKPLIAYTIEASLDSNLDKVVLSTDCKEIAAVAKQYGVEVLMRPAKLAQDDSSTLSVLQHVVSQLNDNFDVVMTLQPTSPLRTSKHINEAIELFSNDKKSDSLVSVVKVPHNFIPKKQMNFDGKYLTGCNEVRRRQDLKMKYARNGAAIYMTKVEKLDQYIFGGKILPYFMEKIDSFDIDDIEDWEIIEYIQGKKDAKKGY